MYADLSELLWKLRAPSLLVTDLSRTRDLNSYYVDKGGVDIPVVTDNSIEDILGLVLSDLNSSEMESTREYFYFLFSRKAPSIVTKALRAYLEGKSSNSVKFLLHTIAVVSKEKGALDASYYLMVAEKEIADVDGSMSAKIDLIESAFDDTVLTYGIYNYFFPKQHIGTVMYSNAKHASSSVEGIKQLIGSSEPWYLQNDHRKYVRTLYTCMMLCECFDSSETQSEPISKFDAVLSEYTTDTDKLRTLYTEVMHGLRMYVLFIDNISYLRRALIYVEELYGGRLVDLYTPQEERLFKEVLFGEEV